MDGAPAAASAAVSSATDTPDHQDPANRGGNSGTRPLSADTSSSLQWASHIASFDEAIPPSQPWSLSETSAGTDGDVVARQSAWPANANWDHNSAAIANIAMRKYQVRWRRRVMAEAYSQSGAAI